ANVQTVAPLAGADPTYPSLSGHLISEGSLQGAAIDFDFDNNNSFDQTATTDSTGGFSIQPQNLPFGTSLTITYRIRQTDPITHPAHSFPTQTITGFNYSAILLAKSDVASLALVNPGAGGSATDPSVSGSLNHAGQSQLIVVQFSHNSFTTIDGQVTV